VNAALCIEAECDAEAVTANGRCGYCAREWRRRDDEAADALDAHEPWSPADLDADAERAFVLAMTTTGAAARSQNGAA
jgi:hypothetical protein